MAYHMLSDPAPATDSQPKRKRNSKDDKPKEFPYIHEIDAADLRKMDGRCVLIDPGRGDLLYCMKETSTTADRCIYRYTRENKRKELRTGHYNDIRAQAKKEYGNGCVVKAAEDKLSST
ncbi:hypothetical protein H4R24_005599, partial [Coemansia sp. RSA 988]